VIIERGSGAAEARRTITVTPQQTGAAPSLTTVATNPGPPEAGQQFTFSLSGSGFEPSTVQVLFNGPGCSPCAVANNVLATKTSATIVGTTSLATAGSFTVTVRNGTSG